MTHDILILGGGPAGLTAAIYTTRAGLSTLVVEGLEPGGQLTITADVENFPGFAEPIEGPVLMANMRRQAERLGTQFTTGEAVSVELKKRPFTVVLDSGKQDARAIIVATGAKARWIGIESERLLRGKGVSACAMCDGFFFKGKEVAVIGGGDTAVEEALFLTRFATKVTIVHRRDELRVGKAMQRKAMENSKIKFAWNSVVDDILDVKNGEVTGLRLKDTKTGAKRELACQGVFVAIGHEPNTKIFEGKLKMDDEGYIITRETSTATSVAGVFAAGDCQDRVYRQAVTAAGSGCMSAIDAARFLQENG